MKYLSLITSVLLISLSVAHAQLAQSPAQPTQTVSLEQAQAGIQALLRVLKTVRDYPPGDRRIQPGQWFVDVMPGSQVDRDARFLVGQGVLEGEYDPKTGQWRLRPKDFATRREMIGLVASVDRLLKMMIVASAKPGRPGLAGRAGEKGEPGEKGGQGELGPEGRPGRTGAQGAPGRIPDLSGLFDAQERMIALFEEFYREWQTAMSKTRYVLHKYEPSQPVPQATPQYIYRKTFFDYFVGGVQAIVPWLAARALRPTQVSIRQVASPSNFGNPTAYGGAGGSTGPINVQNINDIINQLEALQNAMAQANAPVSVGVGTSSGAVNVGTSGQQTSGQNNTGTQQKAPTGPQ